MNEESPTDDGDGPPSPVTFDRYDWSEVERPSVTVVRAVAAVTNREVFDLPQLREYVDPDALDRILADRNDRPGVRVSFRYDGVDVTVNSDGRIEISA